MATHALRRLTAGFAGLAIATNCSGPQPLSDAIHPADDAAYLEHLNQTGMDGRLAYLTWKATTENRPLAQVEAQDAALSTTRNPFDAHRDAAAVSRGGVIYKYHCARCHGDDARGHGPSALPDHPANDFHAFNQRFASTLHRGAPQRWYRSITDGYGGRVNYPDESGPAMPAFRGKLAREQVWLVITYLQSLDMHVSHRGPATN